jgi:geranylgeranylglycerol-phosphate geranylgeranyltransferase
MGFAVIVGAALTFSGNLIMTWNFLEVALGFITGFTLTAASMTVNDYYDREIDAVNEPGRPIPSGAVKPKQALISAGILSGIGFIAAILTNLSCLVIAIFAYLVLIVYVTVGKRTGLPGNFLVSVCVSVPFIYGSAVILSGVGLNVAFFVAMVFLSNTGREITKGIVDVDGDRSKGVRTLAVQHGEKRAAIAGALFYLSAVALSPLPWIMNVVSVWYLPLVTVTDLGLIVSSVMLLRDCSRENARKIKKTVLLWFMFGLLSFIAGSIH